MSEAVNHPAHYNEHPSGVECIDIVEYFDFNVGNAIKYLWRAGLKGDQIEDLRKAAWYVNREIDRLQRRDIRARVADLDDAAVYEAAKERAKELFGEHPFNED